MKTAKRSIKRSAISLALIIVGVALSAAAYIGNGKTSLLHLLYWGILPGFPFVISGILGLIPRIPSKPVWGSAIGALVVTVLSYGSLFLSPYLHPGCGANIGMGIILLGLPLYYAFAMIVGWQIGRHLEHDKSPEEEQQ